MPVPWEKGRAGGGGGSGVGGGNMGLGLVGNPTSHEELTGEMSMLTKLPMPERLRHARKRRAQQLKEYAAYDKQLGKDSVGKTRNKRLLGLVSGKQFSVSKDSTTSSSSKNRVLFEDSILLLDAVGRNDVTEVKQLLSSGVNPNACNPDSLTALHQCCIDNLEVMARVLVDSGADVNYRDIELWTPLHAAATCGHVNICKYLVEHGAELLAVNGDGNMPYDICEDVATLDYIETEMSNRGVTQELIEETRLATESVMLSEIKKRIEQGQSLDLRGSSGETLLHIASCNGYERVVTLLLDERVAIDGVDNDQWQPIHCAACWGQLGVFEILLERGASSEAKTQLGETPLDVCDDLETRQRLIAIVSETVSRRPRSSRTEHLQRGSLTQSSSRRASNASPASHACMRRSSLHEKSAPLSMRDAHEEAQRMREAILAVEEDEEDDDDDDDDEGVKLEAVTVKISEPARDIVNHNTEIQTSVRQQDSQQKKNKSGVLVSAPVQSQHGVSLNQATAPNGSHPKSQSSHSNSASKHTTSNTAFPIIDNVQQISNNQDNMQHYRPAVSNGNNDNVNRADTSSRIVENVSANYASGDEKISTVSSGVKNSGTLSELKRQRGEAKRQKRHHSSLFCLDSSARDDNEPVSSDSAANGAVPSGAGGDAPRRKFVNNDEVIQAERNGCCVLL